MSIAPGVGRFRDRLKAAMVRAGLNQDGFAEKLGAGQSTVNAWLRGRSLPEGKYLVQMPGMLGVSGHWLLTGEPPETVSGQGGELAVAAVMEELRRRVLEAVEAALADPAPTPVIPGEVAAKNDLLDEFSEVKRGAGGTAVPGKGKRRQGGKG